MSARAFRSRAVWFPVVWSALLAVVMLGPALGPGYVLVRDMVWVPDLSLGRDDVLGLGSALPRAVPSDAVVAALDEVAGAMVLQKVLLLIALIGAGTGAAAMVREFGAAQRALPGLVAATVAIWNPFVVERLGIGHWPVLLGWAAVPWLVVAGHRARWGRTPTWTLPVLLIGSLSANAGLVSGVVLLACAGAGTGRALRQRGGLPRAWWWLAGAVVAVNAPWLVAGLAHPQAAADAGGYTAFRTGGDALPGPLTIVSLGGIWNSQVVPDSREGVAAWIGLVLLAAAAVLGVRRWLRTMDPGLGRVLIGLWAGGVGVALVSSVAPDVLQAAGAVPGVALLRDGSRSLALTLPLLVGISAAAVEVVAERLARTQARPMALAPALAGLLLVPVALMPDAAFGLGGQLRAVEYPASWLRVREAVTPGHGAALVLPMSNYRAPSWNHGVAVIDPMGRMLRVPTTIDDRLVVGAETIAGEDPVAEAARRALAHPDAEGRARALAAAGLGWVVLDRTAQDQAPNPAQTPPIAGTVVLRAGGFDVLRLDGPISASGSLDPVPGTWQRGSQLTAWVLYLGVGGAGLALLTRRHVTLATRRLIAGTLRN